MYCKIFFLLGILLGATTSTLAFRSFSKSNIINELSEQGVLFIEPIATEKLIPPPQLSKKQLQSDIEKINSLIKNAYAGTIGLPKLQLNQLDQDLNDLLSSSKESNKTVDICILVNSYFKKTDDEHLDLKIGNLSCTQENRDHLQEIVSSKKIDKKFKEFIWEAKQKTIENQKAGYLSFNGFRGSSDKAWLAFYDSFVNSLDNDILILDLRKNSGGWIQSASQLASHFYLPHAPNYKFTSMTSIPSLIMRVNIANYYYLFSDLDSENYKKMADKATMKNLKLIERMDTKLEKCESWNQRVINKSEQYLNASEKDVSDHN
ncbi:MAG: S41 family peptidase [Oligoflexales bacterium]